MIYVLRRTSVFDDKPCDEAIKRSFENWSSRSCTEEYFNQCFSASEGLWRSKGKNHSLIDGGITRQNDNVEKWSIEINTLEELTAFIDKYGSIVIRADWDDPNAKMIEIYDDYRE